MRHWRFDMIHQNLPHVEGVIESISRDRSQYLIFIGLAVGMFVFVGVLHLSNDGLFQRFLGTANPLTVFLFATVLGIVLLFILPSQQWFAVHEKTNLKMYLYSISLAALFGIIMILVDTRIIFSADMNILFPKSLLFYPAMAFLVEILFHVLPLAVLLFIIGSILKGAKFEIVFWICVLIVASLEPTYQMMDMVSSNRFQIWAIAFVWIHIFLINLFELLIFKRQGFVSMYTFRLVYYMFWHIVWGNARLDLLF